MGEGDERYLVPALDRGLRMLKVFTAEAPERTLAELSRALALPHATAFRLVRTLEAHGLLRRTAAGFAIGPGVLGLGFEYLASLGLIDLARPELEALRDQTGESANLGVLDGTDAVYVLHVASRRQLSVRTAVGSRFPAYASPMGQLLLAGLAPDDLMARFRDTAFERINDETVTSLPALQGRLEAVRRQGFAVARGVYERDLAAIAAPVRDAHGVVDAAVNIVAPATLLADAIQLENALAQVVECARRVSALRGWRGA